MSQFFSASQLSKDSCSRIKYMRNKPKAPVNENMILGERFAESQSHSDMIEMAGWFTHGKVRIHFAIDEVQQFDKKLWLIEHKSVREDELWYFRSCLIQTAFYNCLCQLAGYLKTAGYAKGDEYYIDLEGYKGPSQLLSFLNYGGQKYRVYGELIPIMRYFLTKARASIGNWEQAKRFDAKYRSDEWAYFRPFIKYRKA